MAWVKGLLRNVKSCTINKGIPLTMTVRFFIRETIKSFRKNRIKSNFVVRAFFADLREPSMCFSNRPGKREK
jgi:hypothetical protein